MRKIITAMLLAIVASNAFATARQHYMPPFPIPIKQKQVRIMINGESRMVAEDTAKFFHEMDKLSEELDADEAKRKQQQTDANNLRNRPLPQNSTINDDIKYMRKRYNINPPPVFTGTDLRNISR